MSIKTIFALQAHGERGKSTTLKMLVLKILQTYNTDFSDVNGAVYTASKLAQQIENEKKPNSDVKNICGTVRVKDIVIGVNTAGDNKNEIEKTINLFNGNIDIGICAVRTKGVTVNELNKYAQSKNLDDGKDYFVISKLCLNNVDYCKSHCAIIDTMNEIQADLMFNELVKII